MAALVTAFLVSGFIREQVRTTDILNLGGVSVNPAEDGGAGNPENPGVPTQVSSAPAVDVPEWDGASRVNALVMGLDFRDYQANSGPPRSDTMIVLTYDPTTETAGMLSIPRDLWVNIPGFEFSRINDAYAWGEGARLPGGGPELAVRTVEEFLGIDIHYYAQIDFSTFVEFIDFIGGAKVEVTETIELEYRAGGVDPILEPGIHSLMGEGLLAYIRNRSTGDGDFGRARRQQHAIEAIQAQLLRRDVQKLILSDPVGLWNIFSVGVRTNIPFEDAFKLGMSALKINPSEIAKKVIAPPDYVIPETLEDGRYVLKPITSNIRLLRDEVFISSSVGPLAAGGDPLQLMDAEDAKVAVYNGSVISGLAGATQEYLLALGVNVVEIGNFDQVPATTIYDYTGNPYTIKYLVALMDIKNPRIFNRYDPTSEVDLVVVLGSEWAVP